MSPYFLQHAQMSRDKTGAGFGRWIGMKSSRPNESPTVVSFIDHCCN
jgi:hypothetical protein